MLAMSKRVAPSDASIRLMRSTQAATSIEHALFVAIVGIALLGGLTLTRQAVQTSYRCVVADMSAVTQADCARSPDGDVALTPAAERAQSLLPAGARILLGGVFVDRDGTAGYAAQVGPASPDAATRTVNFSNTGTGQSVTVTAVSIAGVVELATSLMAMIGPGPMTTCRAG